MTLLPLNWPRFDRIIRARSLPAAVQRETLFITGVLRRRNTFKCAIIGVYWCDVFIRGKSVKVCVWYGCWRVRVGVKEGFVVFSDDWYLLKNWGKLVLLYIHMVCGLQSQALQYYTYVTLYTSLLC